MRILLRSIRILTARLQQRSFSMSKADPKLVAVCQMTSVADKDVNLKVVSDLIEKASAENAQMLFFPEACDYLCDNKTDTVKLAEPIPDGNIVNKYRELAAKHKVWLSMGGLHEKDPKGSSRIYNTHVIIDSSGEIVQTYRKLHLFDVVLPERGIRLLESDTALAGGHVVTPVRTPVGSVGLAICYDMRFPELGAQLAGMGSNILLYPSAFMVPTGRAHWEVLLRARAIENQCYVIAAAQVGKHNRKRSSYGHALCVSPWGEILSDCGEISPGYSLVEIDQAKVESVREEMPVFKHKRNDVYSLYTLCLRAKLLWSTPKNTAAAAPTEAPDTSSGALKSNDGALDNEQQLYTFGQVTVPESSVFLKTELSYAFVNIRCVVPGHVLVAPVRPVARNEDLTPAEARDFFSTIIRVQKLMEKVHDAKSSTLNIQDGPDAGQTIWHLHCHVMPRKPKDFKDNDLIYLELAKHDRLSNAPMKPPRSLEEREKEAKMLREELRKMEESSTACDNK